MQIKAIPVNPETHLDRGWMTILWSLYFACALAMFVALLMTSSEQLKETMIYGLLSITCAISVIQLIESSASAFHAHTSGR